VQHPLAKHSSDYDSDLRSLKLRLFANTQSDAALSEFASRGNCAYQAPTIVRFWHLASLDAPTVALVWAAAFAWIAKVRLPWWVLVLLPLCVWSVYVADRLLDVRAGLHLQKSGSTHSHSLRERHLFHWRYRRILAPLAVASALTAAWIVVHLMPRSIREHDSLLAAASLLYFTRVHTGRRFFALLSKEFLVGILFTLGCVLPAWSRANFQHRFITGPLLITTLLFALLAWLNCYAIDRWESGDQVHTQREFARFALSLATIFVICAAMLTFFNPPSACLLACGAIAALILAVLDCFAGRFTPVTLRTFADAALLTPIFLLCVASLLRQ
jgi:hypothetical protein